MSIRPQVPRNPHKQWLTNTAIANNRTYFILCMINYLLLTANPKNTFKHRFKNLCAEYSNVDVKSMGFPVNWTGEILWK